MNFTTPLISSITIGLALAYIFGMLFQYIRIPQIIGYLIAGFLVGPLTPGFNADLNLTKELAEMGIILLMFGVGLNFSLRDLISVRLLAIPIALIPIIIAVTVGAIIAPILGLTVVGGGCFGLCLSITSTVVALRTMEERQLMDSKAGKVSIGVLVIGDIIVILVMVFMPTINSLVGQDNIEFNLLLWQLLFFVGMLFLFTFIMLVLGPKFIPNILVRSAATGSRELFTLSVLVVAMGIAYIAVSIFNVSFALGAFFAGMVLSGSKLSQRAAKDILPLKDALAVLFFVAVGMSFDPYIIVSNPLYVLAGILILLVLNPLGLLLFLRILKKSRRFSFSIVVTLIQIGEFTFILAAMGSRLELFTKDVADAILLTAILSILLNPIIYKMGELYMQKFEINAPIITVPTEDEEIVDFIQEPVKYSNHVIVVGYGEFGSKLSKELALKQQKFVIIDESKKIVEELLNSGTEAILGDFKNEDILTLAKIQAAKSIIYTIDNIYEISSSIETVKELNQNITTVACALYNDEIAYLQAHNVDIVIDSMQQLSLKIVDIIDKMQDFAQSGEQQVTKLPL